MNRMLDLFARCLGAEYTHTAESGDFAIYAEGDTLYLLFEESSGSVDWKNNFDFPARPYKNMNDTWMCHRGFYKVWKAMRDEVESLVSAKLKESPEIAKITCVGYSHGGALSMFATEDMEYLYGDKYIVEGYGFGAPRVLWGRVPRAVKFRLRKYVVVRNIPDLVTHVPPLIFGYHHVGTVISVGEKNKYTPIQAHYASAYIGELNVVKGDEK